MTTLAVRAYYHPGLCDPTEVMEGVVRRDAEYKALMSDRALIWPPRVVTHTPTSDGLMQVDALFDTKES